MGPLGVRIRELAGSLVAVPKMGRVEEKRGTETYRQSARFPTSTGFDLFKPTAQAIPVGRRTRLPIRTIGRCGTPGTLVMDDVAEMRARTPHKGGSLGEVQDFRDRSSFEVDWGCHRMEGEADI